MSKTENKKSKWTEENPFTLLVTGSTGSIGQSVSNKLIKKYSKKHPVRLLLNGRNSTKLEQLKKELEQRNYKQSVSILLVCGDLTQKETTRSLRDQCGGKLNGLVLCHGICSESENTLQFTKQKELERIFQVNFFSNARIVRKLSTALKESHGSVVIVSSTSEYQTEFGSGSYCCSKAALAMLAKTLAVELGPYGVRVNSVVPGIVDSEMHHKFFQNMESYQEFLDKCKEMTPTQCVVTPNDVARAVVFLINPKNKAINSAQIVIDGALSQKGAIELL
ncbi:hypothetical protein M0813_19711 [Anaeramoeba flamelloides]|uniref:Uncharacterized protein n=1 Tax=Anaeramoeba flamelloides TaxID=1746091 RepID=A0ABQ8YMX3_9EUKA|nr:hypothetical protein M0813_19711 [Anaeramoeba flamelloides]